MNKFNLNTALCAIAVVASFSGGTSAQEKAELNCNPQNSDLDKYEIFSEGERKGMRSAGQIRIPAKYIALEALDENLFRAETDTNWSYGLLSAENEWICAPKKRGKYWNSDKDYIVFFNSGFRRGTNIRAIIRTNPTGESDRFVHGVIDENCKNVISPQYRRLWHFMNNDVDYYIFTKIFYRKPKAPVPPAASSGEKKKLNLSMTLKPGRAILSVRTYIDHTKDGIMDMDGNIVVPAEYDSIECDEEKGQLVATTPSGTQILKMSRE